ncbi:MAG: DNRLRE domain-containing protein [Puia sp.]|nr:DNRLRE domain-containing protein [Puia sp.]
MKFFVPYLLIAACLFAACKKTTNYITPNQKPPVVDAGASQSIEMPVDSVSVTGVVTDAKSPVTAYLWSEVSGPNVPVIENEGSLSTEIKGLVRGSYVFQLMAIDTFGLTGVDTLHVTVSGFDTLTLQPNNNAYDFMYIGNSHADYTASHLEVGAEAWTINGDPVDVRSYVKFDLSGIPAGTTILSAKLTLYSNPTPYTANFVNPNYGSTNAFYISRINSSWDPGNMTWSTLPAADPENQILIPQTNVTTVLDIVDLDVTALVNKMMTTGNYGFMMQLQNEQYYNARIYCSSRYSDATKHPKLVVVY